MKNQNSKFLELIYKDITDLLNCYDTVLPYTRDALKRDLINVIWKRVKPLIINYQAYGVSKTIQANQGENQ
jgi:hypothetical protein